MNTQEFMAKMTKTAHRTAFKLQKHSPEILMIVGTAGIVTSVVLACKATLKAQDILSEAKENLEALREYQENDNVVKTEEYTDDDFRKARVVEVAKTGVKLAKVYAPSVVLGVFSICSMLAANDILRKRNVALAAAYATIDKSFKDYRNRVADRFGKEVEQQIKNNIKVENIKEVISDSETGEAKEVEKEVEVSELDGYSEYSRFYDAGCAGWEDDPESNLMFLRAQQRYANDLLQARGHLYLNEVYDMLGIQRSKAGQVVGWIYDEENPVGDNYVDFGIYNVKRKSSRDFVNGYESAILLDFNVDGNIWDLMP